MSGILQWLTLTKFQARPLQKHFLPSFFELLELIMKCLFCVFGIYSLWPRIISVYLPFEQLKFTIVTIKHKLGIFMRDKSSLTKTLS